MYKHILAPIDGSPTSLAALDHAASLAQAFGATVMVVYVVGPYPFTGVGTEFAYGQEEYMSAARGEGRAALESAAARLKEPGVPHDTRVVESHAIWRGILQAVKDVEADLIVMGSHGRRGLERLLLGSVTQSVLAHATCPTLVVRSEEP